MLCRKAWGSWSSLLVMWHNNIKVAVLPFAAAWLRLHHSLLSYEVRLKALSGHTGPMLIDLNFKHF